MKLWNDLKVSSKLAILVAIACLALLTVGLVGVKGLHSGKNSLEDINRSMSQTAYMGEMKSDFLAMRLDLVYMMALNDEAKLKDKWNDYAAMITAVRSALKKYEETGLKDDEKASIAAFRDGFEKYVVNGNRLGEMLLAAHASGDKKAVLAAIRYGTESVAPLYAKPAEIIANGVNANIRSGEKLYNEKVKDISASQMLMFLIILSSLTLSILFGWFIVRSISRPLSNVFDAMKRMAAGDLTVRSNIGTRDEMGQLADELNQLVERLHEVICRVVHNGMEIASAANQLHATSDQMATGAEQAAAQTQTISTASEEMAATSSEIASNCHVAAINAVKVNESAMTSSRIVDKTISVMGQISGRVKETAELVSTLGNRSEEIGEIIGTIEDIADQTNLLALNAAIEAARAGDMGRGFAVVADEVRALAERTTTATKQIAQTIKSIQSETRNAVSGMEEGVKDVARGTDEATKSGMAIQHILEQIGDLSMQVNQIATAAEQQTATTGEITNNIQQISTVVQLTASGSQESSSAAAELARVSEELRSMMLQFRLAS